MTIASDWIAAAYNRSSENDPGKLGQDAELLDHLNRVYQRLWSLLARARPELMAVSSSVALAGNPASVAVPSGTIDLLEIRDADGERVTLAPPHERTRLWHLAPCMFRQGVSLISRAGAGDPVAADVLTLLRLDEPTALSLTSTPIDDRFPVRHHQLAIDWLAMYLATKDSGRDRAERDALAKELAGAAAVFAAEYGLAPSAIEWLHAPVDRKAVA